MTRRQIDAIRERRLWLSQIVIPTVTLAVTAMTIPEVRDAVKLKACEWKQKIQNRMKK